MKHVHKYRRITTVKGKGIWRCVLPGCKHVIYQEELLPGRESVCWMCEQPMIIQGLSQAKPVCEDCKENRKEQMEKLRRIS